ncbi:aldo/keto reductase [Nonomuraea sp. K274]|uniref:Aldo/keto reductase n=1 Tax=Nonomuraea cypriaca TaxID=1187855 RepID=A0A931ADV6_9ACTN|nr:aldo/keto reductase [Nonomuraea cypriaca]
MGVGIVAWSPLGNGFLTGTVSALGEGDFRHNAPRFSAGNLASDNDRYAPIRALAAQLGISPAQLALAWLLHQDEHVVAIPGSRTPAHIEENLASAGLTLHQDTLARIDEALARFEVTGGTLL